MIKIDIMRHQYVETIPETVQDGVLYISEEYSTAVHKCCCGCGQEVVTPLGPTDWRVTVQNGEVCVRPSIGNWSFPCQSHYWIDRGRIHWAEQWSKERIRAGRERDQLAKQAHYGEEIASGSRWAVFWTWLKRLFTR